MLRDAYPKARKKKTRKEKRENFMGSGKKRLLPFHPGVEIFRGEGQFEKKTTVSGEGCFAVWWEEGKRRRAALQRGRGKATSFLWRRKRCGI